MVNTSLKGTRMNNSMRIWTRSIGFLIMAFITFSAIFSRDGLGLAGDDPTLSTLSAMGSGLVNGLNIVGIVGQTWSYKQREYFNKTYLKIGGDDEKVIASNKLDTNPLG